MGGTCPGCCGCTHPPAYYYYVHLTQPVRVQGKLTRVVSRNKERFLLVGAKTWFE